VCTPTAESLQLRREWDSRLKEWYGPRYVRDRNDLENQIGDGPLFYLGWGVYPPVETMITVFARFGFELITRRLRDVPLMSHREQSWLWQSPHYRLMFDQSFGQYEIYSVEAVSRSTTHSSQK
jgi:hypothetical protein